VDADQVVALALAGVVGVLLANVAPGGFELEVDVLLLKRLANFVCAPLVDEELHPRVVPVLAVAVVAEQRGEPAGDI